MKKLLILSLFVGLGCAVFAANPTKFYDYKVKSITDSLVEMKAYKGKVILIVNTASRCGLTPQYEGLEALYDEFKAQGFVVLGFPCNQFLGQEPGSAEEIVKFCSTKYDIRFPLFAKINVNGDEADPLYVFLKQQKPLEGKNDIRWNFEKFLIDQKGNVVKRYAPTVKPVELKADIELLLK